MTRDSTAVAPGDDAANGRSRPPVRAAGGVVYRDGGGDRGGPEICLVHRPRYDDWSLPKGKLRAGEHPLAAAVREVTEETGVVAVPQVRLPGARYPLVDGTAKTVDFWLMRAAEDVGHTPDHEVDRIRWVPLADAAALLSHDRDTPVVRRAVELPPVTAVVAVIRHACAGQRGTGPDDTARPLDGYGRRQAAALVAPLSGLRPTRLVSAAPLRCRQTLEPLSTALDLPIELDAVFNEDADPARAAAALRRFAAGGAGTVVASQGGLIPDLLEELLPGGGYGTDKGAGWLIAYARGGREALVPIAADPIPAPEIDVT